MIAKFLWAVAACLCLSGAAQANEADGKETYDLLFRNGTLDQIDGGAALVYQRQVENTLKPASAQRDTGEIALSFKEQKKQTAQLDFRQDDKNRPLGRFPASVGNPMIMYFYESVVRDMAESAGGSPFYIRNRVKEALIQPSDVETGQATVDGKAITTRTIRLHPFQGDPNVGRMQGFGNLELSVTMSDDIPGWYLSLVAAAAQDGTTVYRSELNFDRVEVAE